MNDDTSTAASAGGRETDLPMPDAAPASESVVVRAACQLQLPDLAPAAEHARGALQPQRGGAPRRLFAVVSPMHDHYEELLATGVVSVIESVAGQRAPLGSMILTDSDDDHGLLLAERESDGWLIVATEAA